MARAEEKAERHPADVIIEKALAAPEPVTALDDGVDLTDRELLDLLLASSERVRKKHGPPKTVAFTGRLVEAARLVGDEMLLARSLSQHATTLQLASANDAAIAQLQEAAGLYDRLEKPGEAAVCRNDVGHLLKQQGKFAAGADMLRKSREEGWPHWTPKSRLTALLREGILARELGRPREAIRIQEEARAIARESADKPSEARVLTNLALIYANLGEYRKAMEAAQASFELRPPDDYQGREISLTNLGVVHEAQGDNEAAIRTFRAAAVEAEKSKEPKSLAITAVNIGIQLRKTGRAEEARPHLEEALRIAGEIRFARLSAAARRELGLALVALGERVSGAKLLEEALAEAEKIGSAVDLAETQLAIALHVPGDQKAAAERALKFAREAEQPEFEWAALTLLGDLERAGGASSGAIDNYTKAVAVIERMRRQVAGGDVQRQTFFADKLRPYHSLVELHVAAGDVAQAFHWIQQAKARVLLDTLSLERRQVSTAAPARQTERIEALQVKIAEARGTKDRAAIDATRAELDAVLSEVAAPAVLAPVATLRELAGKLLDPETALLEYLVLPERCFLSVLTVENGEPTLAVLPIDIAAGELRRRVEELRAALATRQLGYEAIASALWARLLAPAATQFEKRSRLILAPSGSLWQLPFQVLRDDDGRFLIDRFTVVYAPSASSLAQMNSAAEPRKRKTTLVLSNPARADSGREFPDLPGARKLLAELPPIYGREATTVLSGSAATEHALKKSGAEFDTLHCATHGVFDPVAPLASHLRLAPGDGEDGFLEAREIMELRTKASLAVLAACETGRGGEDAGEGVIGMSWAFFLAGCPAVVASQWKVDSASMSELSLGLHRQLASGVKPAIALQHAAQALRKNRSYRHPFYWAPFVAVGAGL